MHDAPDAISIFVSYAHADEGLRNELAKQLRVLERQGIIQSWHDQKMLPGSNRRQEIDQQLNSAQIILLLLSPDFMNSDSCCNVELKRAIERHNANEACVIPIVLRPVDWQELPIGKLRALPTDANPVTKWSDRDEAFFNVTQGIKQVVKTIKERSLPISKEAPPTTTVRIYGWKRQSFNGVSDAELDWTSLFDIDAKPLRKVADTQTWHTLLLPKLKQVREQLTGAKASLTLDIQGLIPLSAALIIGTVFQDTAGYTLQRTQRTVGKEEVWRSNATPSALKFKVVEEQGTPGPNLLMILAISGSSWLEVSTFYADSKMQFSSIVYLEPETGTGEQALRSGADALALALHAKELIRHYRDKYQMKCTHLVLYTPVGFCLFLGSRLRLVGDVMPYERLAYGVYQPSVELQTG